MKTSAGIWGSLAVLILILGAPIANAQTQTSTSSNCPTNAVQVAVTLSQQVNSLHLGDLNSSMTDQQIASEINMVDGPINSTLHITVPKLDGSSIHGLSVLTTPWDDFVHSSLAVDSNNPGTACDFLAATFVFAMDIAVVGIGTATITVIAAVVSVMGYYCPAACTATFVNDVGNFINVNGSIAWKTVWNAWEAVNAVPEFPFESVVVMTFLLLIAVSLIATKGNPFRGSR